MGKVRRRGRPGLRHAPDLSSSSSLDSVSVYSCTGCFFLCASKPNLQSHFSSLLHPRHREDWLGFTQVRLFIHSSADTAHVCHHNSQCKSFSIETPYNMSDQQLIGDPMPLYKYRFTHTNRTVVSAFELCCSGRRQLDVMVLSCVKIA